MNGVCHRLPDAPAPVAQIRELDGASLVLAGDSFNLGLEGQGDVFRLADKGGWERVAMPASHPRVTSFLTLEKDKSLLALAWAKEGRELAILRLTARGAPK